MARVVYIGAPEADADRFASLCAQDLPGVSLFSTNDRHKAFAELSDCEVLIGHHFQFDDAILRAAPRLRWIQSLTTGTDGILKLPSLASGVVVTSTRGIHGPQMSELVFLAMLGLTRDYPRMLRNQQAKRWERWPQPLLMNKTAVIVGAGAIAETLAPRCQSFGMTVLGVDVVPRAIAGFDHVYGRAELDLVASKADYLILILPLTPETANLINARVLGVMKPTAYLINVARGGVLDESALIDALDTGRLAGAALDVFRETPLPASSSLWGHERIVVTPNVGGMSNVYLDQCYPLVRQNLEHFLADHLEELKNRVEH